MKTLKSIVILGLIASSAMAFLGNPGYLVPYGVTNTYQLPASLTQKKYLAKPIVRKDLYKGVSFFRIKYRGLFGIKKECNEVCMLVIDWNETDGKVGLNLAKARNLNRTRPSELMMENPNCIAAFNGFYHHTTDPSKAYFPEKINGEIYEEITEKFPMGSDQKWFDGIIAFNPFEPPKIGSFRVFGWTVYTNCQSIAGGDGMPVQSDKLPDNPEKIVVDKDREAIEKRFKRHSSPFCGHNPTNNLTVFLVVDTTPTGSSISLNYSEGMWILKQFGMANYWTLNLDGGGSVTCVTKAWVTALPTDHDDPAWPQKKYPIPVIENEARDDHINFSERRVLTSIQIVVRD